MDEMIFNKEFLIICLVNFLMMFGQNMTNTLIPKLVNSFGATAILVGMVTSIFSLSSLLVKPFSGPAVDSFKRKWILFYATILIAVSFLGYAFSSNVYTVIFSRLLHGAGLGFTVITCLTMISDCVPKKRMTSGIAYYSVVGAIAQAIGPGLGLVTLNKFGYFFTFLVGFVFVILAAFFVLAIDEKERKSANFKIDVHNIYAKEAIVPAVIMFFLAMVYITISSFLVLHAESKGIANIGLYFTVNAVFLLGTRPLIGKLADQFGLIKVLPIAILFFAFSMVLIGISNHLFTFLIAAAINACGYGACQPLIQSLCMKSVSTEYRGAASATSYYGTDLGYLVGPILAGKLIEAGGYSLMFCAMAIVLVFPLIICFVKYDKLNRIDTEN